MKALVIYISRYYGNTKKIAQAMAQALDAPVLTPLQVEIESLSNYDLIGFGSGIYYSKHDRGLFHLIQHIPQAQNKKAFLFSTNRLGTTTNHELLQEALKEKGFTVIGEFSCKGFEHWGVMKIVGDIGINEGKPDEEDLKDAAEFAAKLRKKQYAHSPNIPPELPYPSLKKQTRGLFWRKVV